MRWWHGGVAAGLGVAIAALLMLMMTHPSGVIEEVEPPAAPVVVRSTVTTAPPPTARAQPHGPRAHPIMPRSPHEEGLLAAIDQSGEGMVRCQLPSDAPVKLDALNWAGQVDDVLTMATTEPSGSVLLVYDEQRPIISDHATPPEVAEHLAAVQAWEQRQRRPFALAAWTAGWPGAMGRCEVHDVKERVPTTVQLRDPQGAAVSPGLAWSGGQTIYVDRQGRGSLLLWPDVPLTVRAFSFGSLARLEGDVTTVIRADTTLTIVLEPAESDPPGAMSEEGIEAALTEHEQFMEEHNRFLQAALEQPGLSTDASAQLQSWIDREERNSDRLYEIVDDLEDQHVLTVQR